LAWQDTGLALCRSRSKLKRESVGSHDSMPTDAALSEPGGTIRSLSELWWSSAGAGYLRMCRDDLRGALAHDREKHGTPLGSCDGLERQLALLRKWAGKRGLLLGPKLFEWRIKGGREHYLIQTREVLQRVIKVTIGPEFGFYPCCFPRQQFRDVCNWFSTRVATPLEYLERLIVLNELYPRCETQLLGLVDRVESLHAVTAQLIARGRPASTNEIARWQGDIEGNAGCFCAGPMFCDGRVRRIAADCAL
jgi:hypothetical protein